MDRLRRVIKWFFVGSAVLLLLVVAAVVIYTRSEHFTRWLREEAVAVVNNMIRGSISVERLEGSVWRDVTLHNVALSYENVEVLAIPRVAISFSLWRLLWGELQISQIDGLKPRASLQQDREGRWNLIEALGPRAPDPEQSSKFSTVIRSLRLRDAIIDLRLAGQEEKPYRLQSLALEAGLGILPDGVSFEAREVAGRLLTKGLPDLQLKGAMDYQKMAAAPATLKIKEFWAVSANSRVRVNGEITHHDTTKLKAHFLLEKLAPADIRYFVADWPLKRELAGSATVEGSLDDLKGELDFAGGGAKLAGKFRVDTEQDPLGYSVAMRVSGFDLRQWLGKEEVAGVLDGTLDAQGRGFSLPGTIATTRFEVRSAAIQDWTLGTVATEAKLENSIAVVDGKVEGNLGSANWAGKFGLKEKRPTYDLALAVKDLAIEKAVSNADKIKGKLNFQGTVKGAGVSLVDMNTRVEMRILPSSIGALNLEKGRIDATLRDRKLLISSTSLNGADSTLLVNGELGLEAKSSGKLDYRFRANNVAPWLSLFDQKGSGSLNLVGQAQGSLADLQTQGSAGFSDLRLDGTAVRNGDVKFAIRISKDQVFPEGLVTFRVADVDAGVVLRRVDGKAAFLRKPAQAIQVDLNAQDSNDRKHVFNGMVSISPDLVAVRLNQLALSAPDGVWKLARPATVSKKNQDFFVEQLSLRNSDRQVALEGRLSLSGAQDLQLTVDRLPLQTISTFMSQPPKMSGVINMTARISGTAAAPEINSSLKLNDPTIAGQAYAGAVAEIHYKERAAAVRMTVQQDTTHSLTANGTLPYVLSWHEKFRAEPAEGMDIRVQSDGLSVAFLNAFAGKAVGNIGGDIALDVRARGSIKQPDLRGTFRLRDGSLKVVPLNVDVNALTISGGLDSGQLIVRDISAKAKDGEIRGSGSLALKQFDVSAVKLSLTAQRWPAIDTVRYQMRIAGKVDVEGSLVAPAIKGQLVITEGLLRPDLNFLEQGKAPTKRDETIVVIRSDGAQGQTAQAGRREQQRVRQRSV